MNQILVAYFKEINDFFLGKSGVRNSAANGKRVIVMIPNKKITIIVPDLFRIYSIKSGSSFLISEKDF